jgi:hypothetical protein
MTGWGCAHEQAPFEETTACSLCAMQRGRVQPRRCFTTLEPRQMPMIPPSLRVIMIVAERGLAVAPPGP